MVHCVHYRVDVFCDGVYFLNAFLPARAARYQHVDIDVVVTGKSMEVSKMHHSASVFESIAPFEHQVDSDQFLDAIELAVVVVFVFGFHLPCRVDVVVKMHYS